MPGESCVVDILGRLHLTTGGYCDVLVLVDRSSKWIACVLMKANTTEELRDALLQFIQRRARPQMLFSDRGGNLYSSLAVRVYERLDIKEIPMAAYRHNAWGMCELAIQTLLALLLCTLAGDERLIAWERPPSLDSLDSEYEHLCRRDGLFFLEL